MKQIPIQATGLGMLRLMCVNSAFLGVLLAQIPPGPFQQSACSWCKVLWPATEGCNLQTSKPVVSCCSVLASRYTGCSSAVMKPTGCGWKASIRGQWTTGPTSYLVETRGCFLQALQLLRSSWKFTGGKKKGKRERFLFLDGSDSPASAA